MSEGNSNKRIDELEIKFTLQEDLIDQLNDIVSEQQFVMDKMQKELVAIRINIENQSRENTVNPIGEKPPHY